MVTMPLVGMPLVTVRSVAMRQAAPSGESGCKTHNIDPCPWLPCPWVPCPWLPCPWLPCRRRPSAGRAMTKRGCSSALRLPVNLKLHDLVVRPMLCNGVKYIGLVSLEHPKAGQCQILHRAPFVQNGLHAKSGCGMCFAPSTLGALPKPRLESGIKEFTPHFICICRRRYWCAAAWGRCCWCANSRPQRYAPFWRAVAQP